MWLVRGIWLLVLLRGTFGYIETKWFSLGKDLRCMQQQIRNLFADLINCNAVYPPMIQNHSIGMIGWDFSTKDWIKYNTDGALVRNDHQAACGRVIWVDGDTYIKLCIK